MRKKRTTGLLAFALIWPLCRSQELSRKKGTIMIEALDGTKFTLTVDQIRRMPQQSVSIVNPHTKVTEKYEGVLLADVLAKANTPSGDKLRGDEMRDYVEVGDETATKPFSPWPSSTPHFRTARCWSRSAATASRWTKSWVPYESWCPQDKRPARSVRMVMTIAVRRAP